MFNFEIHDLAGYLFRRFMVSLFFPSLFFWGALLVVYWSGDLSAHYADWMAQSLASQLWQVAIALVWVAVFASILGHRLIWITQQFEGYWPTPIGDYLSTYRKKYYQKALSQIEPNHVDAVHYDFRLPREEAFVMPTRLGNILRSAELYSKQRYEIESALIWPRLYSILPSSFSNPLNSARGSLELMLIISTLSLFFSLITGIYLIAIGGVWWLFPICFLGGFMLSYLAYSSALVSAIAYGQLVRSAFDLYKDDLRKEMGYEAPNSLDDERKFWTNLCQLIRHREEQRRNALRYTNSEAP